MAGKPTILCVYGSPRTGGNTERLLDTFAEGAGAAGAAIERLYCRDLRIEPCVGCGHCARTGECRITDDDMARAYEAVDRADALAVGTPVYFLGPPAPLKAVIDRFQSRWSRINVLGVLPERERPGVILAAGGAPVHSVFTCVHRILEAWFEVIGVRTRVNLFYEKIDARGDAQARPDILEEVRQAGEKLVRELS